MSIDQRLFVVIEEPERAQEPPRIKLVRRPGGKPGRTADFTVPELPNFDEPGEDACERARQHGYALLNALCEDKAFKAAFDDALNAGTDEVRPLCFKIEGEAPDALGIRWEALWEPSKQFLALQERWPIGRVTESDRRSVRSYEPPLRILAVMSGVGLSARQEWDALYRAVRVAREKGLLVHVTLVLGEEELAEELSALAEETPKWLDVVLMESEASIDRLRQDPFPHIVHFFCHGSVRHGEGSLEFATIADWDEVEGRRRNSVSVSLSRLQTFINRREPWLVVLNCCETAVETPGESDETQSLAREVVVAGAAAAIGWRQTISPADAHALTDTVYERLLGELAATLVPAQPGSTVELELTSAAYVARDRLRMAHANDLEAMRWTLPVLFVTPEPLSVHVYKNQPDNPQDLSVSHVDEVQGAQIAKVAMKAVLDAAALLGPEVAAALIEFQRRQEADGGD